jgi:PAS domain S-box-containing protein
MQRKSFLIIVLISLVAIIGASLLLYSVRKQSIAHVENMFISQQLLLAKQTSAGIHVTIHTLTRELDLLSRMPAIINMDEEKTYRLLEQNFKYVENEHVNDIAVLDSEGIVRVPLNAPHLRGKDFSFREYFKRARILKTSVPVFELIDFRGVDIGRKGIIIAMPIFNNERKFKGLVLYTIKVDDLVKAFLLPIFSEGEFWIIDSSGSVVSHPFYEPGTMINEQPGLDATFKAFLENIRTAGEYGAEYISLEGDRKIAASYQTMIADQAWFFVIASPKQAITRTLVRLSGKYLTGGAIVLLIIIASSIFTIYVFRGWNIELQKEIYGRQAAETALRSSEEFLKSIYDSIHDGISILDKDLNILSTNRTMEEWYSHQMPLAGKKCYEAYHGRAEQCMICPSVRTLESGKVDLEVVPMTGPDGVRGWLEVYTFPFLEFGTGHLIGVIEYVRDISARKRIEEELSRAFDELELRVQERTAKLVEANIKMQDEITERMRVEDELLIYQEKLAALAMELTLTEERERRNIVDDLHDHVVQRLAMAKMKLGSLGRSADGHLSEELNVIGALVEQIVMDTRTLMFNISPPVLYELGFMEAVEWHAEQIQQRNGIPIEIDGKMQGVKLDLNISVILFKAVRELLTNVAKHARAGKAKVSVRVEGDRFHVSVEDDGVGYDFSGFSACNAEIPRFGIFNMLERIKYIGGTVEIESAPGQGTRFGITVPLFSNGITGEGQAP